MNLRNILKKWPRKWKNFINSSKKKKKKKKIIFILNSFFNGGEFLFYFLGKCIVQCFQKKELWKKISMNLLLNLQNL